MNSKPGHYWFNHPINARISPAMIGTGNTGEVIEEYGKEFAAGPEYGKIELDDILNMNNVLVIQEADEKEDEEYELISIIRYLQNNDPELYHKIVIGD